jgi:hypothetical protein
MFTLIHYADHVASATDLTQSQLRRPQENSHMNLHSIVNVWMAVVMLQLRRVSANTVVTYVTNVATWIDLDLKDIPCVSHSAYSSAM